MMKVLVEQKSGKKYLVKELGMDFHTSAGVVSKKELKSKKNEVASNKGVKFTVIEPSFVDLWEQIKRGPQVVLQKDIGLIIAKTGVNNKSRVVDAGGGSGSLCGYLANVCKEVTTYEAQKELVGVLEKNKRLLGLRNLQIKNKDVYLGISEVNLDLITLDLARPWEVIASAERSLKVGGYLAVYLPNIIQMKMFVDALRGRAIKLQEVEELLERKWKFEGQVVRPEYEMLGHTGFLCFCRKG